MTKDTTLCKTEKTFSFWVTGSNMGLAITKLFYIHVGFLISFIDLNILSLKYIFETKISTWDIGRLTHLAIASNCTQAVLTRVCAPN